MIIVLVLLPLRSVEAQQSDLLWPFTSGGAFGSQIRASKLNSSAVLQGSGAQSSKLNASGVLQNSAAESSKLVATGVLQNNGAKASKIVAYIVLQNSHGGGVLHEPLTHW